MVFKFSENQIELNHEHSIVKRIVTGVTHLHITAQFLHCLFLQFTCRQVIRDLSKNLKSHGHAQNLISTCSSSLALIKDLSKQMLRGLSQYSNSQPSDRYPSALTSKSTLRGEKLDLIGQFRCAYAYKMKQKAKQLQFKYSSVSLEVINHCYIYIHFMLMLTKIEIHSLIPSQTSFCHIAAVKPSKRCRYKDVIGNANDSTACSFLYRK